MQPHRIHDLGRWILTDPSNCSRRLPQFNPDLGECEGDLGETGFFSSIQDHGAAC